MSIVLVDSSVLLDIVTNDPVWYDWSSAILASVSAEDSLAINPLIYAEVSSRFSTIEALNEALPFDRYRREALPFEAAFLAGKAFLKYRRRGGTKTSPISDFYIGAHAAISGFKILTRDPRRYRQYFPTVELIAP
ncbi:MAG TPA: type II toxin-antitoxin system VapC family toxin [Pyrinomonadaceae bacterium]|nr:type II toxin-antitoxin system VapC family toxin [Pyrinomonadaceae bacterium]